MAEITRIGPEREIGHLIKTWGLSREEAERIMEDEDLWLLIPEQRHAYMDAAEDVAEWERAYEFAYSLSDGFTECRAIYDPTRQLLWDMCARAEEALRRARERARA
jgi:hypothetical protein